MTIDRLNLRHHHGQETVSLDPPRQRGRLGLTFGLRVEPDDTLDAGYYEAYARLDEQSLGRLLHWLRTGVALPAGDERIPEPFADWVDVATSTASVLAELATERARQTAKHGDQSHLGDGTGDALRLSISDLPIPGGLDDWEVAGRDLADWAKDRCKAASQNEGGDGSITFEHILTEEWAETLGEDDPAKLRAELIQVAAVAVQWVEAIDRRAGRSAS